MRRQPRLALCAALAMLAAACGDDAVSPPGNLGNDIDDETDAGGGGGSGSGSQGEVRGKTPVWPEAEDEIEVPYGEGDVRTELSFDADLSQLDVHVNVDTTSSIDQEIDALQRALHSEIITTLSARVSNVSFGVSRFADFPVKPFGDPNIGASGDRPFVLLTPITSDRGRVSTAVARLDDPLGAGGDEREAGAESLFQIATGIGYEHKGKKLIEAWDHEAAKGGGMLGGVGFRPLSLRVLLHVTDAPSHHPNEYEVRDLIGTHSMEDATTALAALAVRSIAIMSTECEDDLCRQDFRYIALRNELADLALGTRAVMDPVDGTCPTGIDGDPVPTYRDTCPLVFDVRDDGTGLADTVVDAVLGLLDDLRFTEVHAEVAQDPLGLIRTVEAISVAQPKGIAAPEPVDRLPTKKPDGVADTFLGVQRRARLGFRVTLRNEHLLPSDVEQRFRVMLRVVGDGVAIEERTLRVIVPAGTATPMITLDAGLDADVDAAPPDAATSTDDDAGQ